MKRKSFNEIIKKLKEFNLPFWFDMVVAVGRGGIIPGYLMAQKLNTDFEIIWLRFRNDNNEIIHDIPRLSKEINFSCQDKRILLVDDVVKTGSTFKNARRYLKEASLIKTFAINGKADYYLYNETCFKFPWLVD